ncbi:GerMN domain-containing protein [Geotalea sp. SG265]|uniref:GerMN domain-containing protein n=1 Tax=Geotalea sp. SG265 TaxID=2922867 RepID=UPI001FAFF8D5
MKKNRQPRRGMRFIVIAFLVFAAIVGALVVKKYRISTTPRISPPMEQAGTMMVTLFFADENGNLVREGREIEAGASPAESIEAIIDELASGPVGDYGPVVPDSTQVRSVTLQVDEAVVDFGRELYDDLPSGSAAEMTAVYAVVDTIAVNFPQVKKVLFLKEGQPVTTIKGHLDLRQALVPDFNLEKR